MSKLKKELNRKAWTHILTGAGIAIFSMFFLSEINYYLAMAGMVAGATYSNFYTNAKCPFCNAHYGIHPTITSPIVIPDRCMACKKNINVDEVDVDE